MTIFICGDVMTGRGIDQILPCPSAPHIYEPYMKSSEGYVQLAEEKNGKIRKPVNFAYIWGDSLGELERVKPDARIINLETAVTKSEDYEDKGINYRMHPDNIRSITEARIDCCSLANNHILDWGYSGLLETLETLKRAGLKSAGAGMNLQEARSPAIIEVGGKGRVLVYSFGTTTSGIPSLWAAGEDRPGVNLLSDLSEDEVFGIKDLIAGEKQEGDLTVASIHWGGNWGYDISYDQREFAHNLIDEACVDIVHGHSSHHIKGIEVYKGKLICYGCGDFINDYEGIEGREGFRSELGLMYFATAEVSRGRLISLRMVPTRIERFRVNRVSGPDAAWLRDLLNGEGKRLGTSVEFDDDQNMELRWSKNDKVV